MNRQGSGLNYPQSVKLLPRRKPESTSTPDVEAADAVRGKGRPTPKRRETTVVRGPVTAPKTRKEAYARQKQLNREARQRPAAASSATPQSPAERRAAMRSGAIVAPRDQGATRKLARDFVDSRRLFSNYLLVVMVLMLASWFIKLPVLQLVAFAIFIGCIIEWYFMGTKIRKLATERYGKAEGSAMSIGFYAGSRAYLPRRWRLPSPTVGLGDAI